MVQDAVDPESRPIVKGFPWPHENRVAFIHVEGSEASGDGKPFLSTALTFARAQ